MSRAPTSTRRPAPTRSRDDNLSSSLRAKLVGRGAVRRSRMVEGFAQTLLTPPLPSAVPLPTAMRQGGAYQRPFRRVGHDRILAGQMPLDRRTQARVAAVARRDQAIAGHPRDPDPLDRRSGEQLAERRIVQRQQVGQAGRDQLGPRHEGLVGLGGAGEAVPRANRQAIVAAVDAVADRLAKFVRDRPGMLDRQIGDAAPRIDPVRAR